MFSVESLGRLVITMCAPMTRNKTALMDDGREEFEPSSDDGGKSLSSVKSVNQLSDMSLSRPLEVTNSLKGRIWNVLPTESTKFDK